MSTTLLKGIDDQAELARLAAYVAQTMTDAEVEQFEAELRADAEFFDRMSPLLAVWYAREPLPALAREIEEMRAEAAEVREVRTRRRQIRNQIVAALGSLLAVKPMIGGLAVAATVLVALVLPKNRPTDTPSVPTAVASKPVPKTTPQRTTAARHETPAARVADVTPTLPVLDPATERTVDSLTSTPITVPFTKTRVVATGPVAAPSPPVVRLAWGGSPADTIPVPKINSLLAGGRAVLGGLVQLPGRLVRRIFGGTQP
jgi:hypothetical protein